MAELQRKLQGVSDEYQKLENELQSNVEARQKLEAQQQENQGVQKEFSKISDGSQVYKLVGPVLQKQEHAEAKMAVDRRLEFIEKEINRIENQIKDVQGRSNEKRQEIMMLQSQAQAQQS